MNPGVMIVYCHGERIPAFFHSSLHRLCWEDTHSPNPLIVDVASLMSSPRITATRNSLVEVVLAHPKEPEWMLMLDDDMVFTPDLVARLLSAADPEDRPILAGLYFGGRVDGKVVPHAYVLNGEQTGFNPVEGVNGKSAWGPVIRVHGVGAGCLLVHRDALLRIGHNYNDTGYPWFVEGNGGGRDIGEDLAFCLRAMAVGYPIHCHTGVILGHVKPGIIDEKSHLNYLADRELIGEEAVIQNQLDRTRAGSQVIRPAQLETPERNG